MTIPLFDQWCVRSLAISDAEAIARYANNRNVWINVRDLFPYPYTLENAKTFLKSQRDQPAETAWAIASPDEAIGVIGCHRQADVNRLCAEIGYWIGEPFWGRGIVAAAVKVVASKIFDESDIVRLFAATFEWNNSSARVLERAGFHRESVMRKAVLKDGKIIDQFMYVLLREEWEKKHDS